MQPLSEGAGGGRAGAGLPLAEAARQAAGIAGDAVAQGLARLGHGDGPVHALHDVPATLSRRDQQGAA